MKKYCCMLILLMPFLVYAQRFTEVSKGIKTSIRGMSVVSPAVAWVSGSNGWFAKSTDGGKNWHWKQLESYSSSDFRGIWAFSAERAVLMSSGTPGLILYTEDGGESWKEGYRNNSADIFLDGIGFYNENEGIAYGDPIGGKMQLLKTNDGGRSWVNISGNNTFLLIDGEASFAASNTGIETLADGKTWIITGGKQSRVFYSPDKGKNWAVYSSPMLQGGETRGPFSVCFYNALSGVMSGGDYKEDTLNTLNFFMSTDGGKNWVKPETSPLGFRSCVTYISKNILIATGTSGTDISRDGGKTWSNLSREGYHVLSVLKKGKSALLAGSGGRIALLEI